MSPLLENKVALVTGAATGLGRTIATHFAAAGAVGCGLDVAAQCPELPVGWLAVRGDVASERDIERALAGIEDAFGRLDIVVANAGIVPPWHATADIDMDEWERVFAVNVRGVAVTIKHASRMMQARGGSIIAMGSLNSRRAHPEQCAYTASKHAVLGIVRSAALDLGRFQIRVNALGPGPVATDALRARVRSRAADGGPEEERALGELAADAALGRLASEDDVASAALFLASDLSAGISGKLLPVDAGMA